MSNVLRTILILTFLLCLGGIYVNNNLWASGCCGGGGSNTGSAENAEVVNDPVCGMEVSDSKKSLFAVYKGKDYFFCSGHCKQTFKNDPASYTPVTVQQHGEDGGHNH